MAPAAPTRLLTTTGTGRVSLAAEESWRAIWSAEPPGAKPTRMLMGCVGCQAWARAASARADRPSAAPAAPTRWRRVRPWESELMRCLLLLWGCAWHPLGLARGAFWK